MSAGIVQSAYGMTVCGLPPLEELAPGEATTSTRVCIAVETRTPPPPKRPMSGDGAVRRLADGRSLVLDRRHARATFHGPALSPDLLAHPYLSPVATAFSRWAGREAFHGGAFLLDGRAYAVLGTRTAGKSTLLAWLAAAGYAVITDDIVVTDGSVIFTGPRCVDLRDAPVDFPLAVRQVRGETRFRVGLPPLAERTPFGGWVFLDWADRIALRRREVAALLGDLATRRAWRHLDSDPSLLLDLATRPAWTFTRPREWAAFDEGLRALVETVGAAAPAPR